MTPFADSERAGLYRAIFERRDMRRFLSGPIADDVLARILKAAHHAPSVGFMQPWDFILIRDPAIRKDVHEAFQQANAEAVQLFQGERQKRYAALKLEGILETPLNICVTCDRERFGPVVLGRTCQPDMDLYSTVCAVQNLWLAARAEGIGVGWVSILHPEELGDILALPPRGGPAPSLRLWCGAEFPPKPELQTAGWLPRLTLDQVVRFDTWVGSPGPAWEEVHQRITGQ